MKGLKVPKKYANDIIKKLLRYSLMDPNFRIKRDENFVFIPLRDHVERDILFKGASIVETTFMEKKRAPRDFKEFLKDRIRDEVSDEIRRSFDIIGDVVILEIPNELEEYKHHIGGAVLEFTKKRAVFRK